MGSFFPYIFLGSKYTNKQTKIEFLEIPQGELLRNRQFNIKQKRLYFVKNPLCNVAFI